MKQLLFFFLCFTLVSPGFGQVLQPAFWENHATAHKVTVGGEIELVFKATIDPNWYLYSSDFDPDCGPMVTSFSFQDHPGYELVGDVVPNNPEKKYDEIFECDVTIFKKHGEFRQKVKVLEAGVQIEGSINYQVCTDIDGKCIPFEEDFSFTGFEVTPSKAKANEAKAQAPVKEEKIPAPPTHEKTSDATNSQTNTGSEDPKDSPTLESEASENQTPVPEEEWLREDKKSLWAFMAIAFLSGLAALITPCVFPMIPMTVTFFMKDDGSDKSNGVKKGIIFGVSIILIYTILGTIFALIFGADGLNALSTHWLPNVFIFVIFLIFALSFLGLFEITLPSNLVTAVDKQSERGGLVGVFFMAFTLALVSFSCTVPIVGSVLVLSAGGAIVKPVMGMLAFSLAFALPFTLFAIFPEWLRSLPKSGGWLNSVKVVLGFLELALGLKFLSIADQAYHWRLLDREVYLALWIVIFAMMGFYLLGKIRLPHDSALEKIGVFRLLLAILTFSFVAYLVPGMFGAPLKALAGYLPPMTTQDFDINSFSNPMAKGSPQETEQLLCEEPKYADFLHFPHAIKGYFDYQQALNCAKEQQKPIFIDFTGHGCVNCREMEARVWSDPSVLNRLKNDFVMLALYVDDKTKLPESDWYTSSFDQKVKKSIGKQNADFQITRFNNNAQPFYVLLDPNEKLLMPPKAYDLDIPNFVNFLDEGLNRFQNRKGQFPDMVTRK